MSVSYTPTAIYHPQVRLPSPGDAATAQSVNTAALKYIADNAAAAQAIVAAQYVRRAPSTMSRGGGSNYDTSRLWFPASALGLEGVNVVLATYLTSDVVWTIDDDSCVNGDWFFVYNSSNTYSAAPYNITINSPNVAGLVVLAPGDWCMFERPDSVWTPTDRRIASEPLTVADLSCTSFTASQLIHGQGGGVTETWTAATIEAALVDCNVLQAGHGKLAVDVNGNLTTIGNIVAAALTLSGALNVGGGMQVGGPVQFFNGLSAVLGQIVANAGLVVQGASTFNGLVTCQGGPGNAGRIVEPSMLGASADTTYSPVTVRRVYVPAGTLSSQVRYTVSDTGCVDGDWIEFTCLDNSDGIYVVLVDGTYRQVGGAGAPIAWCRAERIAGVWRFTSSGPLVVNA